MRLRYFVLVLALSFSILVPAHCQTNPNLETGIKPFGSYDETAFDSISNTNGNLTLHIPLFAYPQRGDAQAQVKIVYNNKGWKVFETCFNGTCNEHWGWMGSFVQLQVDDGTLGISWNSIKSGAQYYYVFQAYTSDGAAHLMFGGMSTDGTGIYYNNFTGPGPTGAVLLDRHGAGFNNTLAVWNDPNGNSLSVGNNGATIDTLGHSLSGTVSDSSGTTGCSTGPLALTGALVYGFPGPNGTTRLVKTCFVTTYQKTNFQAHTYGSDDTYYSVAEAVGQSALVIQSIIVYNGTSWSASPQWTFEYGSSDPNAINYGDLTKITLPEGGTISYGWYTSSPCYVGAVSSGAPFTPASRSVGSKTIDAKDGSGPQTATFGPVSTDPAGNQTVHTITGLGGTCSYYETQTDYYNGAVAPSNLLKTVIRDFTWDAQDWLHALADPTPSVAHVEPIRVTTKLPIPGTSNFLVTKVETDYNKMYGLLLEKREYDYGTNAPGALLRRTTYAYKALSDTSFLNANLLDRLSSVTVYDGSGNQVSLTTYSYDSGTLQPSGITTQHLSVSGPRGNQTSVQRWLNTTGGTLNTTTSYYDTGMPYQVTDPNGNVTTYSYSSTYAGAYLTQTNLPDTGSPAVHHVTSGTYDSNTGLLTGFTDQNNLSSSYSYDPLSRMTSASFPDGGQTTFTYTDTPLAVSVERKKKINSTLSIDSFTYFDGLARQKQTALVSDPQATVYTDTTYDGLGRVHTVSNPYRTGVDPTTSLGTTTYFYDGLGRKCLEVPPDGTLPTGGVCPATQPANDLFTTYSANTTTVTDQTGKSRKSVTDGLGRLTQVFEDPAGLNYETDYAYDALGNLLTVNQKGGTTDTTKWRTRTFSYDSLSRLRTSNNPETGTITYKYDSDTNCASPNSFSGLLVSKTDARGLRTCAQYDALNRVTQKNYSDTTPTAFFLYDQNSRWGINLTNTIGRLVEDWNGQSCCATGGAEIFSYDPMGRVLLNEQYTPAMSYRPVNYTYDLAGNATSITYPSGRVVNYSYDSASRAKTAVDGSNGITYATDFQTAPTGCLAGAVCYTPQETFYALSIGQTSSFTGLNLTHSYNSRLQPNEFKASSTGGNAIDITYGFVDPITTHNAGHVYSITNNLDTTRSQTFTYDQLNRITSALTTSTHATSPAHCWGETYQFDNSPTGGAWGNLTQIAATTNPAYTGCSQESGFNANGDGNNHLNSFSYDTSGNTQNDGTNAYTWDAESQLKTAAGVTYAYDAQGRRVSKSTGKNYVYSLGGEILAETDASGNTTAEYVFFGGKRVAMSSPATGLPGTGSATVNGSEQSTTGPPAASGTGSVTFSGTLQSKQVVSQAGTAGTGSVSVGGTLQSKQQTTPATSGTGSVTFSAPGYIQSYTFNPCQGNQPPAPTSCPQTVYDGGGITLTINGQQFTINYTGVASSDATAMATAINQNSSYVTATASGNTTNITAKTTGSGTNYSLSCCTYTWNTGSYNGTPFFSGPNDTASASGSSLTGGANSSTTTIYDSGSCTITVNSHGDSASWSGSGTTNSSIASALASSISGDGGASISASAAGSTVNLAAKTTGAATNYSLSSSCSYDTSHFSSPSFSTSNSGSALTGGKDAVYTTVYDSGTSTITVNGHADSVSWSGSGTTTSSIASGLASSINADSAASVSASASGSAVNLTAKTTGASTNYSLSSSSTYDTSHFSSASFSSGNSGSALTGGRDVGARIYDSGNVWVTINGTQYSVGYGQGSSSSSIASALASTISAGSLANATASGSSISITSKSNGAATNYSFSSGSSTSQGSFSSASFTASTSGSALTGGRDGISYYVEDLLGTSRVMTTNTGVVCYDADFYPYGGERSYTNTCPQNYKFEGKERDSETGNDDFGARYYSNRFGRWLSADWSAVPVAVPYANLSNPQTLNLYAMVADDPESFADLDGHCVPWCTAAIGAGVGALGSIVIQKIHDPHGSINWKQVGAAALGGAVAGGTMGLMAAPVVATSLTGSAIVVSTAGVGEVAAAGATAGVLGGVAERAVENDGDVRAAIGTPGQIAVDAAVGAVSGTAGRQAGEALPAATGAKGTAKEAARLAAKHPPLSGSALAKQTSAAAAVAAGTVASQETVGEAAGHAATEAIGQAVKPKPEKDKP
jgi:RHS repeat-associated protein